MLKDRIRYKGRPKSICSSEENAKSKCSLMKSMIVALRIVYKANPQMKKISGKIYSIVTDHYRPSPSRLRDWISSKSTGYEALHIM
jgi:GTP pyrophosphokinase